MEHIKIKSRIHILKRTGWAILLVSMILAGGIIITFAKEILTLITG